jgi:hypothetical protein
MVDDAQELRRLGSDRKADEHLPDDAFALIDIDVYCPSNAHVVLDQTRSLLEIVLRYNLEHPADDDIEPGDFAIDKPYWESVLPSWFVEKTPFHASQALVQERASPNVRSSPGRWTVEGWLYWFIGVHEDRQWRWWSASVDSTSRLTVVVAINDLPFPWESLRWAFLASGATSAELRL